mmetsp:Transcript_6083/g.14558  ORF Transcript_6083/g.14558 Transcript_6083/m.14558 type:complete len:240 (-) Transcript_6083:843-1562(-)
MPIFIDTLEKSVVLESEGIVLPLGRSQLILPLLPGQQIFCLERGKLLLEPLFSFDVGPLHIAQGLPKSRCGGLQGRIFICWRRQDLLHLLNEASQCLVGTLDDGRVTIRGGCGQNTVPTLARVDASGRSTDPSGQSRPQHVVHGILENCASPIGAHGFGPGDAELKSAAVVRIDGKESGGRVARRFVQDVAFGMIVGLPERTGAADGIIEHVADILINELVVTRGSTASIVVSAVLVGR